MASSSGSAEIVEVRDESDSLHSFSKVDKSRIKPIETGTKPRSYPVGEELDQLIDAVSLRPSPRVSRHSSKKPVKVCAIPESPNLKQALRRLCISQASEMAAIKRASKLMGSSSISDIETIERLYASRVIGAAGNPDVFPGKEDKNSPAGAAVGVASDLNSSSKNSVSSPRNALSSLNSAKMRRAQELISAEHGISKTNVLSLLKSKQESVASSGNYRGLGKFSKVRVGTLADNSEFTFSKNVSLTSSKKNPEGTNAINSNTRSDNGVSREKGECSQTSHSSSLGDCSSTTSISEDSHYCGSNNSFNRPHMAKDARWAGIHIVVKDQESLGLESFKLLQRLGCGDIGTVYLAELLGTGCLFALKVMDIEFLVNRKKMLRAQTEREILEMLDHPFLPTLYAHFTTDNLAFLVMEYCPGGDLHVLRQMQPGRRFNETAARFYVAEVLLALEYLHMLGVIYRDLKPENILVRDDGHIMLSDFDLSMRCTVSPARLSFFSLRTVVSQKKVSASCTVQSCINPFCLQPSWDHTSCFNPCLLSSPAMLNARNVKPDIAVRTLPHLVVEPTVARSNSFVGTHEYLAPEIIKGDGHGSSVDWWTLGIFLYELLFGHTPFKGTGNEETLTNVITQSLAFPDIPDVSFYAKDLITELLRKVPERRLGSVRGAAEIKQHPFFEGLNWALIRSVAPPNVPGGNVAEIQKEEVNYLDFKKVF